MQVKCIPFLLTPCTGTVPLQIQCCGFPASQALHQTDNFQIFFFFSIFFNMSDLSRTDRCRSGEAHQADTYVSWHRKPRVPLPRASRPILCRGSGEGCSLRQRRCPGPSPTAWLEMLRDVSACSSNGNYWHKGCQLRLVILNNPGSC